MTRLRQFRLLILVFLLAAPAAHATDPTPAELAAHKAEVRKANELLNGVLADEVKGMNRWLPTRGLPGGPSEDFDIHVPSPAEIRARLRPQTKEEMVRDRKTYELVQQYYSHQGDDRYTGAFLESASPDRWNLQRWVGWLVPKLRRQLLDNAKNDRIRNIRFGVNIGDINLNRPQTVEAVVEACKDMWARGISPTLSVLFFPSLEKWESLDDQGRVDVMRSHLLNPSFPKEAGRLAQYVLHHVKIAADQFNAENAKLPEHERQPFAQIAVNGVNEAETLVAFQNFWHGGLMKWGDANLMNMYVPASINVGSVGVEIRKAIFNVYGNQRVLKVENPAVTDQDYPSHQGDLQFFVNKLIIGHDDLMKADFEKLRNEPIDEVRKRFNEQKARDQINVVDAAIVRYIDAPANAQRQQEARSQIIDRFLALRQEHLDYQKLSGQTASDDTMLMLDYYQQSEFILPKPVPEMIRDLSANHGAGLKNVMNIKTDEGFFNVLRERAHQAESFTNQKLWHDYGSLADIDFEKFLSQEDAFVLDKLLGLRSEWSLRPDQEFAERRARAGWTMGEFSSYHGRGSDELRDDGLLSRLLENDAAVLKNALGAVNEQDLRAKLREAGRDTRYGGDVVEFSDQESLRDVLNKNERTILHRAFGFRRMRRVGFLPPHMARQVRAKMREGFAFSAIKYINELGIRVGGIGEWGTPYPWVPLVIRQMRADMIAVAHEANFYYVRADGGSLMTPIGWMGGPVTGTIVTNRRRGADGIYKFVRIGPKDFRYVLNSWEGGVPYYIQYRDELAAGLQHQREKKNAYQQRVAERVSHSQQQPKAESSSGSHEARSCSLLFR